MQVVVHRVPLHLSDLAVKGVHWIYRWIRQGDWAEHRVEKRMAASLKTLALAVEMQGVQTDSSLSMGWSSSRAGAR